MTSRTIVPTQLSNPSWSNTPRSSKNAVNGLACVARPFESSDLPPEVDRTKESASWYDGAAGGGGDAGVGMGLDDKGRVVEEMVRRSVTI